MIAMSIEGREILGRKDNESENMRRKDTRIRLRIEETRKCTTDGKTRKAM